MALEIPEFLVADIRAEAGFRHQIFGKLQADAVCNDGALSQCDIGKRPCMHKDGLAFQSLDQIGLQGFDHPGGHGAVHTQIGSGDRGAVPAVGNHNTAHTLAQISQIARDSQYGHDF